MRKHQARGTFSCSLWFVAHCLAESHFLVATALSYLGVGVTVLSSSMETILQAHTKLNQNRTKTKQKKKEKVKLTLLQQILLILEIFLDAAQAFCFHHKVIGSQVTPGCGWAVLGDNQKRVFIRNIENQSAVCLIIAQPVEKNCLNFSWVL